MPSVIANKKILTLLLCILMVSSIDNILHTNILSQIQTQATSAQITLEFNSSSAYSHISTQLDFGFRVPGTAEHENCAEWIGNQICSSVDEVVKHNFTIQKESQPSYDCQNILGKMNTDEKNIVILASHWDSRNVAEKDVVNQSLPIPGANDGASGVGVLIELSRVLNSYKEFLDCEIWFLFLDAEDQGSSRGVYGLEGWNWAEGAKSFAEDIGNFYDAREEIECFILLDMVGGFDLEFVKEHRSNAKLHDAIFSLGQDLNYSIAFPNDPKEMSITDDHVPFYELGIPVIDLIIDFVASNWTYHHTHSDNLENIDQESLKITGETIESFIKTYYSKGDNLSWNNGLFSNNLTVIIVTIAVIFGVFSANFLLSKRRKRK